MEYDITTTCGTKEELPHLTQDEYDALTQNDTFVRQVRVPLGTPPDVARPTPVISSVNI